MVVEAAVVAVVMLAEEDFSKNCILNEKLSSRLSVMRVFLSLFVNHVSGYFVSLYHICIYSRFGVGDYGGSYTSCVKLCYFCGPDYGISIAVVAHLL